VAYLLGDLNVRAVAGGHFLLIGPTVVIRRL
jgi:hypothetical protein